ncbi:MAG: hypothetical protein ABIG71_02915, partial [Candidatus Uhrbacteria bacterium]
IINEIPIVFRDRTLGTSKLGAGDAVEFFRVVFQLARTHGKLPHRDGITTWTRLPRGERRFALGIALTLIIITTAPYLVGWLKTPEGFTHTGLHAISGGDLHVYLSYIEQARDGHIIASDLYTEESSVGMFQLFWYLTGVLARILNCNSVLAFHLVRLACIVPYIAFLTTLIATCIKKSIGTISATRIRKLALLLVTFAGGLGGLLGVAFLPYNFDGPGFTGWFIDFWVPEAFTFLTIFQSGHFIVSTWLMLFVYLATIRFDHTRRIRWTIAAALAGAALFTIHPFYIPSVIFILTTYTLVRSATERRWCWPLVLHLFWIGFTALPAFIYWGLLAMLDPVHISRAAQNLLLMPPIVFVLIGYGFLLPLGIYGCILLARRWRQQTIAIQFLITWTMANLVILWAPFPWQRRFTEGFQVALAMTTTIALVAAYTSLQTRLPQRIRTILCTSLTAGILLFFLFGFTNVVNIARDIVYYVQLPFPEKDVKHIFYYPTSGFDAMAWLRAQTPEDAVVFAPGVSANFIPGRAIRRVFVGHAIETAYFAEKFTEVAMLSPPSTNPNDWNEFFYKHDITHIFAPSFEPTGPHLRTTAEELGYPVAYENDMVIIYAVPAL